MFREERATQLPPAVQDEIVVNKGGMPGAADVEQADWIRRTVVADLSVLDRLPSGLRPVSLGNHRIRSSIP